MAAAFSISVFSTAVLCVRTVLIHAVCSERTLFLQGLALGMFCNNVHSYQTACMRTAGHLISEKTAATLSVLTWLWWVFMWKWL